MRVLLLLFFLKKKIILKHVQIKSTPLPLL